MNFDSQINQNNNITLNDCFLYNQKTELYIGDDKLFCSICKQLNEHDYSSKILSSPNVLIIILNRWKENKDNIKLDFTETLDLTQFVELKKRPKIIYNLYGVIPYVEQNTAKAHYIGFCKSPINNKWYKYNDANVNPVEDVQKEIINSIIPSILFYQKSK